MQVTHYNLLILELKPSDLHSVEMVGDAVRIPVLQTSIKEVYGIELSKTLSPDECVARGTSLYVNYILIPLGSYEFSIFLSKGF